MILYSIKVFCVKFWICCAAVAFALPTPHYKNAVLYIEETTNRETLGIKEDVSNATDVIIKFLDTDPTGCQNPILQMLRPGYCNDTDVEHILQLSENAVDEDMRLPSQDEDVEDEPTSSDKEDVENSPSPSNGEDVENTPSPFNDEDVENTPSPSTDEDVENTRTFSDNEDVETTPSIIINEDVECMAPPVPDICEDARIDTITRTQSGNTYIFKGNFYWKILPGGIPERYPRKISDDWDGLEGNLDASVTWSNGKTFFFKGKKYWRFTDKKMDSFYPKLISVGFEGIPDDLDAALVWSGNGKTYFFKGDKYWRYNLDEDPPVTNGYPASITAWSNELEDGIDAAFQWENGYTYFFKDNIYYRYNDETSDIDYGYPLSTSQEWFGCRHALNNTLEI